MEEEGEGNGYKVFSTELAGRPLSIEFGKYAQQANGSAFVRYGDTVVMVNATMSEKAREGVDFFPLSVDFEEKQYSVGKIPGGFIKREGRPTEKATLTCRLIDRPLRPLFPKGMRNDVQVVATCLSVDKDIPPEIPAMIGSSAALSVSDIPWGGPTGTVVVGCIDGEFVINPTEEQRQKSSMHLTVSGTADAVLMVEAGANEVSEETMLSAILYGHEEIKKIVAFIEQIKAEIGKEKAEVQLVTTGEDVKAAVREFAYDKCCWVFETPDRHERKEREDQVQAECNEHFAEQFEGRMGEVDDALYYMKKEVMRRKIIEDGVRPDGRTLTQIRPIWCETGVLPRTHGTGVFTRGETQVMSVTTLAPVSEAQVIEGLGMETSKRYMHNYNFPPYSTGEAGRLKSPGRREIGHGALAERSIAPVIPDENDFPYAIRVSSEIMESNGSTSMASVCAGTMSLLAAGVPLKRPVSGISVGLVTEFENEGDREPKRYKTLLDIIGSEDFYGDMDFKLCGSSVGVTGYQLDLKLPGIPLYILEDAIHLARKGRLDVLDTMNACIPGPQAMSPNAPRIESTSIPQDRIGELIGPGGKNIKALQAETGTDINIEEDGTVRIYGSRQEGVERALYLIDRMFKEIEVGETYEGKIVSTKEFGAFMEVLPGKDGLIHISELAEGRTQKTEDVVKVGDIVTAKCIGIDDKGRVKMSMRAAARDRKAKEAAEKE